MAARMYSLSFVLPAFNEAANIERSIRQCVRVGESLAASFEVIVVDDGSRDDTRRRADALAAEDAAAIGFQRIRTLHHPRNRGYGAALKTGLLASRHDKVFFTDADLQFDVAELRRLLAWAEEYDIVVGYRAPRRDPLNRRFNGWAWSRLVGGLFDLDIRDVDCAFKVFDRSVFRAIPIHSIGAFVNTEILVRARAAGFRMMQVPVTHYPRQAGVQTGANPKVVAKAFRELFALYRELKLIQGSTAPTPDSAADPRTHAR